MKWEGCRWGLELMAATSRVTELLGSARVTELLGELQPEVPWEQNQRFTSVLLNDQLSSLHLGFSSVEPSSVQFFETFRAAAVHFSVGEGSDLLISFSFQFSSVRFSQVQISSL